VNATEDGDEPVGEAPEYVIITAPLREALTSIPVLGENERQAIAEIRALHAKESCCGTCDARNHFMCASCGWGLNNNGWPCQTIDILDERGL